MSGQLPPQLYKFLTKTISEFFPDKPIEVILFGSRARGDQRERSDWDLAFSIPESNPSFFLKITQEAPTLCQIDAVDLKQASPQLKQKILAEGIKIYESN